MGVYFDHHGPVQPYPPVGGGSDAAVSAVGHLCRVSQLRNLFAELKNPPIIKQKQ